MLLRQTFRSIVAASLLALSGAGLIFAEQQSPPAESRPQLMVFLALYERGPAWVQDKPPFEQPFLKDHIAHFEALGDRLIAAGSVRGSAGEQLSGVVLFKAADLAEAEGWLAKDPIVINHVSTGRIVQWGTPWIRAYARD